MATTQEEAEHFLREFKEKKKVFDIAFLDRAKNVQGYLDLEITPVEREKYIDNLKSDDYSEGPNKDNYKPGASPYWVFGILVKKKEVYIKLSKGTEGNRVLCMSFHIAEHPMTYPFKKI